MLTEFSAYVGLSAGYIHSIMQDHDGEYLENIADEIENDGSPITFYDDVSWLKSEGFL